MIDLKRRHDLIKFCLKIMQLTKEGYEVVVGIQSLPDKFGDIIFANWRDKKGKLKYYAIELEHGR